MFCFLADCKEKQWELANETIQKKCSDQGYFDCVCISPFWLLSRQSSFRTNKLEHNMPQNSHSFVRSEKFAYGEGSEWNGAHVLPPVGREICQQFRNVRQNNNKNKPNLTL